jgi:hypothetical protein
MVVRVEGTPPVKFKGPLDKLERVTPFIPVTVTVTAPVPDAVASPVKLVIPPLPLPNTHVGTLETN